MTYQLPEWSKHDDLDGKAPSEIRLALRQAYQAGQADAREDITIAYMAGYSKGRDSMKA